jgi:DDE superfamily endonuclease
VVKAIACEVVYETERPLSRQSLADLAARACRALGKPISRRTVWRMLHADALKPWR